MITVLYFAWLRERLGRSQDHVPAGSGMRVDELVAKLRSLSELHQAALSDTAGLRVAINQELSDFSAIVGEGDEVALFPPMTGG